MRLGSRVGDIGKLAFVGTDIAADIHEKYGFDGDLLRILASLHSAI
jgi:hypothetical protein